MPRRMASVTKPKSAYKYQSIAECEESTEDGKHIVSPSRWPPQRVGNSVGKPSMALTCDLCGCNVIVYEAHVTGELDGVTVNLPEAEVLEKRGPGRPRKDAS